MNCTFSIGFRTLFSQVHIIRNDMPILITLNKCVVDIYCQPTLLANTKENVTIASRKIFGFRINWKYVV